MFENSCFWHFPRTQPRIHIGPCSWALETCKNVYLFWAGDGRFCGGFPLFGVFETRIQTCHLFYCIDEVQFLRSIFWAKIKSGNFGSPKIVRFLQNPPIPLLHPIRGSRSLVVSGAWLLELVSHEDACQPTTIVKCFIHAGRPRAWTRLATVRDSFLGHKLLIGRSAPA